MKLLAWCVEAGELGLFGMEARVLLTLLDRGAKVEIGMGLEQVREQLSEEREVFK